MKLKIFHMILKGGNRKWRSTCAGASWRQLGWAGPPIPRLRREVSRPSIVDLSKLTRTPRATSGSSQPTFSIGDCLGDLACEFDRLLARAVGGYWGLDPRVEFARPATAGPLPHSSANGGWGDGQPSCPPNHQAGSRLTCGDWRHEFPRAGKPPIPDDERVMRA